MLMPSLLEGDAMRVVMMMMCCAALPLGALELQAKSPDKSDCLAQVAVQRYFTVHEPNGRVFRTPLNGCAKNDVHVHLEANTYNPLPSALCKEGQQPWVFTYYVKEPGAANFETKHSMACKSP
jgi:hypothetical protein